MNNFYCSCPCPGRCLFLPYAKMMNSEVSVVLFSLKNFQFCVLSFRALHSSKDVYIHSGNLSRFATQDRVSSLPVFRRWSKSVLDSLSVDSGGQHYVRSPELNRLLFRCIEITPPTNLLTLNLINCCIAYQLHLKATHIPYELINLANKWSR